MLGYAYAKICVNIDLSFTSPELVRQLANFREWCVVQQEPKGV